MRARWRAVPPPRWADLVITGGLLIWGLPDVPWWWEYPGHAGSTPNVLGSLALTLAMSVPFWWRRRVPLLVLVLAGSVLAARIALNRDVVSASAAVLVAAYGLGAYSVASRRYARWLGWLTLAMAVVVVAGDWYTRLAAVPFALLGAAFVLGDAASARRSEAAAAVEAAHQAERTRIARELHDVLAHQLSAIAVQAGAARLAASSQPGPPPMTAGGTGTGGRLGTPVEVLGTVERLARDALTELSHLLGALRQEPVAATRPPAPTLGELAALLDATRAAGVAVGLAVHGAPRPLSPGMELSCYRIVSEALTNVVRHAPGAATQVHLSYQATGLVIEVVNAPSPAAARPAAQPRSGGHGLRGMRERAELYGGHLTAGPRPGGGFAVTAALPWPGLGSAVPVPPSPVGETA